MLDHDVRPEAAELVFAQKPRQELAAKGNQGAELGRSAEKLMNAPLR